MTTDDTWEAPCCRSPRSSERCQDCGNCLYHCECQDCGELTPVETLVVEELSESLFNEVLQRYYLDQCFDCCWRD